MPNYQSSLVTKFFIVIVTVLRVTKCSHVEISKAENLEFQQQKVKEFRSNFTHRDIGCGSVE